MVGRSAATMADSRLSHLFFCGADSWPSSCRPESPRVKRRPPASLGILAVIWVRLFFVGGPISLSGGGEAGGNWIRQGVVRSGGGSGGRRYFCRQRPMGDFRWSSRAS